MALINFNGDLIDINVLISGLFMPLNLPIHLFVVISFNVVKVEHFTAIILQGAFKFQGQFPDNQYSNLCFILFYRQYF